ncbi:hypothetical protein Q5752_003909 [Cryptotrichosporon argae]
MAIGRKAVFTKQAGGIGAKKGAKAVAATARRPRAAETRQTRARSPSDSSGSDDEGKAYDRAAMLAALEVHGRAMFGLPGPSVPAGSDEGEDDGDEDGDEDEDEGEASGDGDSESDSDDGRPGTIEDSDGDEEEYHTDDGWGADDPFVSDSEDEEAGAGASPSVPEVVFAPSGGGGAPLLSDKAAKRAFLSGSSTKMMGIKAEQEHGPRAKRARAGPEDEDEQSNKKLDETLHSLLMTTLLPSSAAPSRPSEKRQQLSARLHDLASPSSRASAAQAGAGVLAAQALARHPAHIRAGLVHARAARAEKGRAEAEAAGSWVRGLGGLGDAARVGDGKAHGKGRERSRAIRVGDDEALRRKKGMESKKEDRVKGLGMGVGRFEGGALRLSEGEIRRMSAGPERGRGRGRGGGGRR